MAPGRTLGGIAWIAFGVLAVAAAFGLLRWPRAGDFAASPGWTFQASPGGLSPGARQWVSGPIPPVPGRRYRVEVAARNAGELRFSLRGGEDSALWSRSAFLAPAEGRVVRDLSAPAGTGSLRLVVQWAPGAPPPEFSAISVRPLRPGFAWRRSLAFWCRVAALGALAAAVAHAARGRLPERLPRLLYGAVLPAALAGVVVWGVCARYDARHGFNALVSMGDELYGKATARARQVDFRIDSLHGYDGAQYVQVALDPLLSDPDGLRKALDVPSYRARRIGLPWLAWLAGLGQPAWIVQAEALLNAAFWALLLVVLLRAFPEPRGEHAAVLGGVLLATGTLESLRNALTDLPATAFLALGLAAREWGRPLAWSAAVLTRETSLIAAPFLPRPGERRWGFSPAFLTALALSGGVAAAWFGYVAWRLPGGHTAGNFLWPFQGMAQRIALVGTTGGWLPVRNWAAGLAMFSLLAQAAYLFLHRRPASAAWRMGVPFALLFLCLGPSVWESYFAVTRAVLPLTLAFHWELASRRGASFWGWWLAGNLYLGHGIAVYLMPD